MPRGYERQRWRLPLPRYAAHAYCRLLPASRMHTPMPKSHGMIESGGYRQRRRAYTRVVARHARVRREIDGASMRRSASGSLLAVASASFARRDHASRHEAKKYETSEMRAYLPRRRYCIKQRQARAADRTLEREYAQEQCAQQERAITLRVTRRYDVPTPWHRRYDDNRFYCRLLSGTNTPKSDAARDEAILFVIFHARANSRYYDAVTRVRTAACKSTEPREFYERVK